MNNKKRWLILPVLLFFLSACNLSNEESTNPENQDETNENIQNNPNVVTRNQLGAEFYRPALDENGRYQISNNRGITLSLNSGINISLFEKDLMRLSQEDFPTDSHFIQEGQNLSENSVKSWIARESEDNPEGLNPPDSGEGNDRVPRYLNSILEFDFFTESDNGLQLAGMSIGLALNTVDYYQAEQFGPTLAQEIPSEEVLNQGQSMANELLAQIRQIEGLENIPIMIGLYEQSAQDDLAGGVYIAQGSSANGSTTIDNWNMLNEERMIFPLEGSDSAEGNAFANFQSEVESFFPNISGITGRAHYIDNSLTTLSINIMTQFYGEGEMVAYTQYLKQSATTYLPGDLDIEIIVESPGNVEAFLKKDRTDSEYFSYVFD
ncbi:MAG TPA: CamS family sex pheromone protein [Atopostipes sp.]|jgi:Protein involved in sex pheromone biosynthesis|nr:CamS family sex pheromone protein [Atopostipes sp.]